jgi:hypothetical protein
MQRSPRKLYGFLKKGVWDVCGLRRSTLSSPHTSQFPLLLNKAFDFEKAIENYSRPVRKVKVRMTQISELRE